MYGHIDILGVFAPCARNSQTAVHTADSRVPNLFLIDPLIKRHDNLHNNKFKIIVIKSILRKLSFF